jgi:hypothetical protein
LDPGKEDDPLVLPFNKQSSRLKREKVAFAAFFVYETNSLDFV